MFLKRIKVWTGLRFESSSIKLALYTDLSVNHADARAY